MKTTRYTIIYTDYGDTCDGLARILDTVTSLDKADKVMKDDVKFYLKKNPGQKITEESSIHVLVGDTENGCQWQILSI